MHLIRDPDELAALLERNCPPELSHGFEPAKWLSNGAHFALRDGDDVSMFEALGEWPSDLNAHLFFASRGKAALDTARRMLSAAFDFGALRILGKAPQHRPHVLWFVKRLGFVPYGLQMEQRLPVVCLALTRADHLKDLVKSQPAITS